MSYYFSMDDKMKKLFVSLLLFFSFSTLYSINQNIQFKHFTIEDGLTSSFVTCIMQDRHGYMWFGTYDGLNCFNGYEFTIFKNRKDDPCSISDNTIVDIHEDVYGNLWIGTKFGLDLYDYHRNRFVHFRVDEPLGNYISDIIDGPDGEIVVASNDRIYKTSFKDSTFTEFVSNSLRSQGIDLLPIRSVLFDDDGKFWIASQNAGVICYDVLTEEMVTYHRESNWRTRLSSNEIMTMRKDSRGNIWICTRNGLNVIDRENDQLKIYKNIPKDPKSLSNNICLAIYEDVQKNMWIGTNQGINILSREANHFIQVKHRLHDEHSLNDNSVQSIYGDKQGNLWVGTLKGINLWENKPENFITYNKKSGESNTLSHYWVSPFLSLFCFHQDGYEFNESMIQIIYYLVNS